MDYNRLKCFLMVAKYGSVTDAAKVLFRTQSAISQQIKKLEKELSTTLFQKIGKKLLLTNQGEKIFSLIEANFQNIEQEISWVLSEGRQVKGHIDIAVLDDAATSFLFYKKLAAFCKQYPDITFTVVSSTSRQAEKLLIENRVDFAILINFTQKQLFITHELAREKHLLVSSKEYIKRSGPFDTIDQVLSAALIDLDDAFTCIRPWVRKNFPEKCKQLLEMKPAVALSDHKAIFDIVHAGFGISISPEYMVLGKLVPVLPKSLCLTVGLDLAYKKENHLYLHHKIFLEFLTGK